MKQTIMTPLLLMGCHPHGSSICCLFYFCFLIYFSCFAMLKKKKKKKEASTKFIFVLCIGVL